MVKNRFFQAVLIFAMFFINCKSENSGVTDSNPEASGVVMALTTESFKNGNMKGTNLPS
jgi:hypothetical protein